MKKFRAGNENLASMQKINYAFRKRREKFFKCCWRFSLLAVFSWTHNQEEGKSKIRKSKSTSETYPSQRVVCMLRNNRDLGRIAKLAIACRNHWSDCWAISSLHCPGGLSGNRGRLGCQTRRRGHCHQIDRIVRGRQVVSGLGFYSVGASRLTSCGVG